MLFEQSELDINFLSLAVTLSNFTYKVGNVCLRRRQSQSHYLYENLPVKSKMAFLSRILILPALLLYEQYIHHI